MNSRKLFALFMVFALTGGALAGQQNTINCDTTGETNDPAGCDPLEAKDVTAIQQHSVFVEVIVEAEASAAEAVNQIHEFAAVVGLVKECKQRTDASSSSFDNAVLWFNDQFLFGDKQSEAGAGANNTTGQGANGSTTGLPTAPGDLTHDFVKRNGDGVRWEGCSVPDGFMHAIGADDPYGTGAVDQTNETSENTSLESGQEGLGLPSDNIDYVKELIDLDEDCQGCIFEYQSTFFVTDPNDNRWMVDKLIYPGSLQGNLFAEGSENCASDSGTLSSPDDPRDNYPHHDRCEDTAEDDDRRNHCSDDGDNACGADSGGEGSLATIGEPIFTVHVQVNPQTMQGFADKASWAYSDGTVRDGMPYPDDETRDDNFASCKNDPGNLSCSIEYDFLITVDFAAFDNVPVGDDGTAENERIEDAKHHGEGQDHNPDSAEDGNSHDHNPESLNATTGAVDAGPAHKHDALNLDLFHDQDAPYFVEENPYWDAFGGPPHIAQDCSTITAPSDQATPAEATAQQNAVEDRTPIVCDVDADDGEFHRHDGTQTP